MSDVSFKTEIEKMQRNGVIFYTFDMFKDDYEVINVEKKIIENCNEYTDYGYRLSPKFKNKKLVNEFKRHHNVLYINTCDVHKDLNDFLKNIMTMQQFEKMVEDWDTKRKLKEMVNNNNRKKKVRVM